MIENRPSEQTLELKIPNLAEAQTEKEVREAAVQLIAFFQKKGYSEVEARDKAAIIVRNRGLDI